MVGYCHIALFVLAMLNECRTARAVAMVSERFLEINGITHYLWRSFDQDGVILDILVQPKRDRFAAIRLFRKLLRATGRRPSRDHH
ncbi:MAG TPA: DDE-type integrase/transposase/recombinase [Bryobacteraceae bacterium]|nr:DDE-type integrase/transposase/recombinase [Bryobacteraceae bacterium]